MLIWGLSKTGKIMTGLETESFSSNTKSFGSEKITLKWYYWKTIKSFFCHSLRSGRPWQPAGTLSSLCSLHIQDHRWGSLSGLEHLTCGPIAPVAALEDLVCPSRDFTTSENSESRPRVRFHSPGHPRAPDPLLSTRLNQALNFNPNLARKHGGTPDCPQPC